MDYYDRALEAIKGTDTERKWLCEVIIPFMIREKILGLDQDSVLGLILEVLGNPNNEVKEVEEFVNQILSLSRSDAYEIALYNIDNSELISLWGEIVSGMRLEELKKIKVKEVLKNIVSLLINQNPAMSEAILIKISEERDKFGFTNSDIEELRIGDDF